MTTTIDETFRRFEKDVGRNGLFLAIESRILHPVNNSQSVRKLGIHKQIIMSPNDFSSGHWLGSFKS